jgi:hypothetical protein
MMASQRTVRDAISTVEANLDRWFSAPASLLHDKPRDGSWSIAENLEHVSQTNYFLLKIIRRHVAKAIEKSASGLVVEEFTNRLDDVREIRDRASFNWKHPTHMTPTGSADLVHVRQALKSQFDECRQFMDSMEEGQGYLVKVNMTVNNLGKLNMYEWIYFLTQHAMRHDDKLSSTVGAMTQLKMPPVPVPDGKSSANH